MFLQDYERREVVSTNIFDEMFQSTEKKIKGILGFENNMGYTCEKHTQILISLLKAYGIRNIVASPGVCNINFVYSIQNDDFFNTWSCIDERSAAYVACGIAQTTGEPVAISCTGATSSRNYMSALTEAYYSKLPILAITSSRDSYMIGNGIEQITDRRHPAPDIVKYSVEIDEIHDENERLYCETNINRALTMLTTNGGGPVHINLITHFKKDFSSSQLIHGRHIKSVNNREMCSVPIMNGKIGIYLRPNSVFNDNMIKLIEKFCEKYNAVVVGDHLSNYPGKYFIEIDLLIDIVQFDLLIIMGTINRNILIKSKKSWRVSLDEKIEDPFLNLEYNMQMSQEDFLEYWLDKETTVEKPGCSFYEELNELYKNQIQKIPGLPFSSIWVAKMLTKYIPNNSICYFGIFSTLRNWSYFQMKNKVKCFSTVGGYGIDGTMSASIGASLVNPHNLVFCFLGDLSFFYDMNVLGNRDISNNIRIMIFNNDGGNSLLFQNGLPKNGKSGKFVGAPGHYKNSPIQSYSEALGYEYLSAINKDEFNNNIERFIGKSDKPIVFEVSYDKENDFESVGALQSIIYKIK